MNVTDGQLKAFYLFGIALNALALAFSVDEGEYLFASAFAFIILYLMFRYRMIAGE